MHDELTEGYAMTVRDLIVALQECNPDDLVILSKDGEGNAYSPLSRIAGENNIYLPESTYSGEVGLHHLTDELRAQGYSEEDVCEDPAGKRAVVLWPIN